ncbi:MAG: ABC transporter permease subunit [Synergistaceae bacterium]|nr:ABC transporter permease subunit [Synergistaceae bacterium]
MHTKSPEGFSSSSDVLSHLTRERLAELESRPRTPARIFCDYIICLTPVIFGLLAMAEYLYVPNLKGNNSTNTYTYFLLVLILIAGAFFITSIFSRKVFYVLRYKAPFYAFVFVLLALYDYLTLKTGRLVLPYFTWTDQILNAMWQDRAYLLDCTYNSLKLLFSGYFTGALLGLITGIACGCSKTADYWISPFMKLLGAIPSPTWIPIVMVIAATLFSGAVFIIALGVWYSLTIATMTGIRNIDRSFYDAAKTLGASRLQLIFNVAVPFAVPNILQGLTQGMSSACMALITAEMVGVESGLGWYVSWQKSWAQYGKMYAAIVILCIVFIIVNRGLNLIKRRLLRWQEGMI